MPAPFSIPKRPPKLKTITAIPRGPREFTHKVIRKTGPGEIPDGFLGNRNSAVEWPPYWALAKIFNNPVNPRIGPFDGGWPEWTYQKTSPLGTGIEGSIIDFVVWEPGVIGKPVAFRIQTEHYHLFVSSQKHAYDTIQRERLLDSMDVVEIYDQDFLWDETGQAIIVLMKQGIGLLENQNPVVAGTAIRASRFTR